MRHAFEGEGGEAQSRQVQSMRQRAYNYGGAHGERYGSAGADGTGAMGLRHGTSQHSSNPFCGTGRPLTERISDRTTMTMMMAMTMMMMALTAQEPWA